LRLIYLKMRSKNVIVALVFMSIIFFCCTGTKSLSSANKPNLVPDSTDVVAAKSHWSGVTLASLNQGYAIYSDKCVECHEMKMPQDFSVSDWNGILPKMGKKANLDTAQYKLVYHYILTKRETVLAAKK